ncbi:hypothetical protein ACHAXR_008085 [Thalassiosira sp. AJA248-18]
MLPASMTTTPTAITILILLSCTVLTALSLSFTHVGAPSAHITHRRILQRSHALKATVDHEDLFWPSSSSFSDNIQSDDHHEEEDEEEILLAATLDSVVKIFATHSEPDFLIPWQKQHQTTSTSSGFVLNIPGIGYRVMTNAHSVEYGSVVQVQRRGEAQKHAAIVEALGNECDLALLRVDSLFPTQDDDAGDGSKIDETTFAMPLGPLPSLQDEVEVLGYPAGGDSLCVTKGVVSRIEMQEYAQAGERLLAMQIDAAINPGNSGGPVVNEMLEVVGVAFQGIDEESVENVGYVVPSSVVLHFVENVRRNNGYKGFCRLGIECSFLENDTFRKFLKLDVDGTPINGSGTKKLERSTGVMVRRVQPTSGAYGFLRSMDVILAIDDISLGNDGKIPFRRGERVDLGGYITSLFEGDEVQLTIWREGKEVEVSFPVSPINSLVPSHYSNQPPPYLICSGLVFTALSVPYLEAKGAWSDYYTDNISYLLGMHNADLEKDGDEVVVLAQVLAHRANLGYENHYDLHLLKFNGVEVRSLRHLKELITDSVGPFMAFEFAPKDGGRLVVLDRETNDQVTKEVCEEHAIGMPFVLRR